jgi:hypothetical protein
MGIIVIPENILGPLKSQRQGKGIDSAMTPQHTSSGRASLRHKLSELGAESPEVQEMACIGMLI